MNNINYPNDPCFNFMKYRDDAKMLTSAYSVINRLEKWIYMRDFVVDKNTGFMFNKDLEMNSIMDEISKAYVGHSGTSMGIIMRTIQYIAKNGFRKFRRKYLKDAGRSNELSDDDDSDNDDADDDDADDDEDKNTTKIIKNEKYDLEYVVEEKQEDTSILEVDSPTNSEDQNHENASFAECPPNTFCVQGYGPSDHRPEDATQNSDSCPVCLETCEKNMKLTKFPCNHHVCTNCVSRMVDNKPVDCKLSCPLCRGVVCNNYKKDKMKDCYLPKDYPSDVTFDFMKDKICARMIGSAYQVITKNNDWETLQFYIKHEEESYNFPEDENIDKITEKILEAYPLHSGSSMGFVMKHIHYIARHGYSEYRCKYIESEL